MFDNTISGNRFSKNCSLNQFSFIQEQLFYSPMLKSQLNFKMQNLLPITNKPEMPGFNDTGMHRPHSYFMKLLAFNIIKRVISNILTLIGSVFRIPNRLQPWMIRIRNTEILMNLTFKFLKCKIFGSEGIQNWSFLQLWMKKPLYYADYHRLYNK